MTSNTAGFRLELRQCPICKREFNCPRTAPPTRTCGAECGLTMRKQRRVESDPAPAPTGAESSEIHGDSWTITLPRTRIHTLEKLVEYSEVDLDVWEVERWVCNKWEVGAKDADSRIQVEPLFQVKAWFRKKRHVADALNEIAALKVRARELVKSPPAVKIAKPGEYLLEIAVVDHHMGMLAWSKETGFQDYDTAIAERLHDEAIESLLAKSAPYKIGQILLVTGNDLLHSDTQANVTFKGTPLDVDSRYHKVFTHTREMVTRAIERCRRVAPVKVVMVPGNHDRQSVWHLGDSLQSLYHATKGVEIDNSPRPRKYHEHGRVLLMFTHGDKGKHKIYPNLMLADQPEACGRTRWREAHVGHFHADKVTEINGIHIRILPSLTPPDAWHSENGFIGHIRASEAFIWSPGGLAGTAIFAPE